MDIKGKIEVLITEREKATKTRDQARLTDKNATVLINKYDGAIEILQQLELEEQEEVKEAKKAARKKK